METTLSGKIRLVLERPLPGICLALAIGVVCSVIIAMRHDVRWLLILPWFCAMVMVWEALRLFSCSRKKSLVAALLASSIIGLPFIRLYVILAPEITQLDKAGSIVRNSVDTVNVFQAGEIVGKAFGGRREPNDAMYFSFVEISGAGQLDTRFPIIFSGVRMRILSADARYGAISSRMSDGTIYQGVRAIVEEPTTKN